MKDTFIEKSIKLGSVLIGLSFYLVVQSWQRWEALTVRLNEELEDFRNIMRDSDNEE